MKLRNKVVSLNDLDMGHLTKQLRKNADRFVAIIAPAPQKVRKEIAKHTSKGKKRSLWLVGGGTVLLTAGATFVGRLLRRRVR